MSQTSKQTKSQKEIQTKDPRALRS